jgi:hypothetical protein
MKEKALEQDCLRGISSEYIQDADLCIWVTILTVVKMAILSN